MIRSIFLARRTCCQAPSEHRAKASCLARGRYRLASICLIAAGCAGTSPVQTRAAFDLNCPQDQLKVTKLDDRTNGVEGCGKRATYLLSCPGDCQNPSVCQCTWVMNSAQEQS